MPKLIIAKSVLIEATPDKVFNYLVDFNNWSAWSPWLILEPEAKVKVTDGGKFYEWEGPRTGSGEMKLTSVVPNEKVHIDLTFLKPWKSTSKVWFELSHIESGTQVTWHMNGSLPFFLFFMKKMMEAYVGMDFSRGLLLLKDCLEKGEVESKLEFVGRKQFPGCKYVGITANSTIDTLGQQMQGDFGKLGVWANDHASYVKPGAFSIYHKWDIVSGSVRYTAAIMANEVPAVLPEGFISGEVPESPVNSVQHTGPYHHLGNAWSAQYNLHRSKSFKLNKKIDPFEIYVNMPGQVPDKQLVTEILFPVV